MLDTVLRGGWVVDGTGATRRRADVGIREGRVAAVGADVGPAAREIDVGGLVVCPGFIDVHTHFDAQAFWDPLLTPSILHGVTTVFGGNCGFSIAPLAPDSAAYVRPMLSRVEGMPIESLAAGVPWDWESTAEFLQRLEGRLALNSGWLVGHSALRAAVMGAAAKGPAAAQIAAMQALLREGLRAGAMGFSSTWAASHTDHKGEPVPSRYATQEELVALCSVAGEFPGTTLEFIPNVGPFEPRDIEAMTAMSAAANRPLNWNSLMVDGNSDDYVRHQLGANDYAIKRGGRIVALTPVDSRHHLINLHSGFLFDALPGWDALMALAPAERIAELTDRERRAALERQAATAKPGSYISRIADWPNLILVQTFTERYAPFAGRPFGEIAGALGCSAFDAFIEIALADTLRTVVTVKDHGLDAETWRRVAVWRDPETVVGASDAGAHLDMADGFTYPTVLLGKAVRDLGLLPLEEAVMLLTTKPAALYGVRDRGTVRQGAWADLVVLDPAKVGAGKVTTRFDLPAGAARLYAPSSGMQHVFVNGVEVLRDGETTGATPGRVLRAGRDTATVTTH